VDSSSDIKMMVDKQLLSRDITDRLVINAISKIPRHLFVPEDLIKQAYQDCALPIGEGQTISQPYMVALMSQCLHLKGDESILEIGTGSGYQTAVLAQCCKHVYTIERIASLSMKAKNVLNGLGISNVTFEIGDGGQGWVDQRVIFDGMMITAATNITLDHMLKQLSTNGKLVVPFGDLGRQILKVFTKSKDRIEEEEFCECVFVPLITDQLQ